MMADDPKAGENIMLSSYIGRWLSLLMLLLLVTLAAAAIFVKPDYPAHVPVRIGICAFDSASSGRVFRSFATNVREQDGGDISWIWLPSDTDPAGCDFYIMTSPQMAAFREKSGLEYLLLATGREDGALSMGAVITRRGAEPDWSRAAFTSTISASGFISPLAAMAENGVDLEEVTIETVSAGCPVCGEAVVYGVLFGRFGAGGISIDELRRIEGTGSIEHDALRVLYTGPELPEVVLASDPSTEEWKSRGFARRLPRITDRLPDPLKREMTRLGMAGFREPLEGELELLNAVSGEVWKAAGYHFP
jgi:hypothetical protein